MFCSRSIRSGPSRQPPTIPVPVDVALVTPPVPTVTEVPTETPPVPAVAVTGPLPGPPLTVVLTVVPVAATEVPSAPWPKLVVVEPPPKAVPVEPPAPPAPVPVAAPSRMTLGPQAPMAATAAGRRKRAKRRGLCMGQLAWQLMNCLLQVLSRHIRHCELAT